MGDVAGRDAWRVCRESADGRWCYLLGEPSLEGRNVICVGVNPATAGLSRDDRTTRIVREVARGRLGCDGFLLVNLYPLRCADPGGLPDRADAAAAAENLRAERDAMGLPGMREADVWAAWGDAIAAPRHRYLVEGLRGIVAALEGAGHAGS